MAGADHCDPAVAPSPRRMVDRGPCGLGRAARPRAARRAPVTCYSARRAPPPPPAAQHRRGEAISPTPRQRRCGLELGAVASRSAPGVQPHRSHLRRVLDVDGEKVMRIIATLSAGFNNACTRVGADTGKHRVLKSGIRFKNARSEETMGLLSSARKRARAVGVSRAAAEAGTAPKRGSRRDQDLHESRNSAANPAGDMSQPRRVSGGNAPRRSREKAGLDGNVAT